MPSVPILEWTDFRRRWDWREGEHVTLVGHTGSGKSTLALSLILHRKPAVVLGTKPKDDTLDKLRAHGWEMTRRWPPPPTGDKRIILAPKVTIDNRAAQAATIKKCLAGIYTSGGWTIYADELRYVTDNLKLKMEMETLWLQGRSMKVSVMAATQRPVMVPLEAWSQATHVFMWRESDKRNLDRLVEIGGVDTGLIRNIIPRLAPYNCLYVNTRDGSMAVTWPPRDLPVPEKRRH